MVEGIVLRSDMGPGGDLLRDVNTLLTRVRGQGAKQPAHASSVCSLPRESLEHADYTL